MPSESQRYTFISTIQRAFCNRAPYGTVVDPSRNKGPEHSPVPFSITLFHNLIFIDTGNQCDSGFFEVNLAGGVYEAHGEDFSFKSFCLPVHSAGSVHLGCFGAGSAMLLGKVVDSFGQGLISRRSPCPPERALSNVKALLNGQGLYDTNRPCPKQ